MVHLSRLTEGLSCLRQSIVNCFFIGEAGDRRWILIDAGMPWSNPEIVAAARLQFGAASRPAAIVLTHGHFDHVGNVRALAEQWESPIFAHELELPYLIGKSSYPPPDPAVGGGAMSLFSRLFPRGPIDLTGDVEPLPTDGSVPGAEGWRWIHTPGHTPGHVSLFRPEGKILVAGDAFVTQRQESLLGALLRRPIVWRPPAYFTCDWDAAFASIKKLVALEPDLAATGHGMPVGGQFLRDGLRHLLDQWESIVPTQGRYVERPAQTDSDGVVSVPPPVLDRQLAAVLGVAVVATTLCFTRRQ